MARMTVAAGPPKRSIARSLLACLFVCIGGTAVPAQTQPAPSAPVAAPPVVSDTTKPLDRLFLEQLPNVVTTAIVAILAWLVGSRLTALWEFRKKRAEQDLALTREFHATIAEFKAASREWELLRPVAYATDAKDKERFPVLKHALLQKIIAAESAIEGIVLKLATELDRSPSANVEIEAIRSSRLTDLGLMRVSFRRLRELVHDNAAPPGFGDADQWLFNRLAADLSTWIYSRAAEPLRENPFKDIRPLPPATDSGTSKEFLRVLAVRTVDLEAAIATVAPAHNRLTEKRHSVRRVSREQNAKAIFKPGVVAFVMKMNPKTTATEMAVPPDAAVAFEHAADLPSVGLEPDTVAARAAEVFELSRNLTHHVVLADAPQRVILTARGQAPVSLKPLDSLPADLPLANADAADPYLAVALLRWSLNDLDGAVEDYAKASLTR